MNEKELQEILKNHKHWVKEDCEGWEEMRANLTGANLTGANLTGADLTGATLTGATLYGADLYGADLYGATLYVANLSGANLSGANLSGADLSGANLSGANLTGANLTGAENVPYIPYACPDFGMFIGFKKAETKSGNLVIVVLEIPEDAKRLSATGRKCRCDKAKVLQIQNIDGTDAKVDMAVSSHDRTFVYTVGEMVSVDNFCEDRWQECSAGIHFFINRKEAVNY